MKPTVVEILNVPKPSPPVPQTSMPFSAKSDTSGSIANLRKTEANAETSSAVSPLVAKAFKKFIFFRKDFFILK